VAASIIDGRAAADELRAEVARDVEALSAQLGHAPGLATVLVGDDAASGIYVGAKQRACAQAGIRGFDHRLSATVSAAELTDLLERLNQDDQVSGILLQLPLPEHLDPAAMTAMISPRKDVDGLTPISAGLLALGRPGLRPCTPSGVMALLARQGVELAGAEAVVVGRSNLFGKPMAALLLAANATVTVCHSRTHDLGAVCARAQILVVAVGIPGLVRREWVAPGAVVIDVGINRGPEGLVGDVDFEGVREVAGAITPVPGGVGPMTIASLLANTVLAARAQAG